MQYQTFIVQNQNQNANTHLNSHTHLNPHQNQQQFTDFVSQNKKQLQQLLSCHICYQRARGASMCPFCSKIYCQNCIKKFLATKQQCPNCRKSLKTNSMTYCSRFINQISFLLEDLIEMKTVDEKCIQHNVEQNYYCRTCGLPICCECEMFGEHKGHHIDHLSRIYELKCQPVREGLLQLKKELKDKESSIKEVQKRNSDLVREKERRLAEVGENDQIYRIRVFAEIENDEKVLAECEQFVRNSIKITEQIESQLVIKSKDNSKLTNDSRIFQQQLQQIETRIPDRQPTQYKLNTILRELVPAYQQITYTVQNFTRRRKQKSIVYSPIVDLEGTQWRLKVHPNGSQKAQNVQLSIFLQLFNSIGKDNVYEYRIEICNPSTPGISFYRQYRSNFEENGSCWGYINYMKLDELMMGGYLDRDCLTIKYSVRHPSYYHYSKFQQEYCEYLDAELEAQVEMIQRLEQELRH